MFRNFIRKFIDYDIVGEYYDTKGDGYYKKKYIRKYYLKCFKKKRRGGHK